MNSISDAQLKSLPTSEIRESATMFRSFSLFGDAIRLLTEVIDVRQEGTASDYFQRGHCLGCSWDYVGSLRDLKKAATLDPSHGDCLIWISAHLNRLERYDECITHVTTALDHCNQNSLSIPALAFYNRYFAYYQLDRYVEAIADLDEVLQREPEQFMFWNQRAVCYCMIERYDEAIADLNEALRLEPNFGLGYSNRGDDYRRLGLYDKAILDLDRAIELMPEHALTYYKRGLLFEETNRLEESLKNFKRAFDIGPAEDFAEDVQRVLKAMVIRSRENEKKARKVELERRTCNHCGRRGDRVLKKCSGCGSVRYCNTNCQRQAWRGGHNQRCRKRQRNEN